MWTIRLIFVGAVLYVLFLLAWCSAADAATCFADAYGVHRHTPGSWAGWTRNMPGYEGQKCYYPTVKKHGPAVVKARVSMPRAAASLPPRSTSWPVGATDTTAAHNACYQYCARLLEDFDTWLYLRKHTELEKIK